jgi:hypothetical protein
MQFVKRKVNSRFLHEVAPEQEKTSIKKAFEEWCKKEGGDSSRLIEFEEMKLLECRIPTETGYVEDILDYVDPFLDFIEKHRQTPYDLAVTVFNKLIGGNEEVAGVEYMPKEEKPFYIGVTVYSEESTPYPVEFTGKEVSTVELPYGSIKADVEDVEAVEAVVGKASGDAYISDAKQIKNVLEELLDEARDLANKALEEGVRPSEVEEEW